MKQGEYHMAKKIHLRLFKIFVVIIFIFNLASCTNEPHLNWFTAQQIYQDHIDLYFKDDKRFKRTDFYAEYYIGKFNISNLTLKVEGIYANALHYKGENK